MNIDLSNQQAFDFVCGLLTGSTRMAVKQTNDGQGLDITIPGPIPNPNPTVVPNPGGTGGPGSVIPGGVTPGPHEGPAGGGLAGDPTGAIGNLNPNTILQFYGTARSCDGFYIIITSDILDEFTSTYQAKVLLGFNSINMQTSPAFNKISFNIQPCDDAAGQYTDYMKQQRAVWNAVSVSIGSGFTLTNYDSISDFEDDLLMYHKEQPWPKQPGTPQLALGHLNIILESSGLRTIASSDKSADDDHGRIELMTMTFSLTSSRTMHLKNDQGQTMSANITCQWDRMGFMYIPFSNCYVRDTVNTHVYPLINSFTFHTNGSTFYPSSLQRRGNYLDYGEALYPGYKTYDYLINQNKPVSVTQQFSYVSISCHIIVTRNSVTQLRRALRSNSIHPVKVKFIAGNNSTVMEFEPGEYDVQIPIPIISTKDDMSGEPMTVSFEIIPDEYSETEPASVVLTGAIHVVYSMSPTTPAIPTKRKVAQDIIFIQDNVLYDLRSGSGEVNIDEGLILTDDVKYHLTQTIMKVLNEELYLTDKTKWYLKESMDKHMGTLVTLADDAKYLIDTPGVKKLLDNVYLDDNVKSSITTQIRNRINDELQR